MISETSLPMNSEMRVDLRALEVQRASLKLSGCLDDGVRKQRNHFEAQVNSQDSSLLFSHVSEKIKAEFRKSGFSDSARSVDLWASRLDQPQLLSLVCLFLKRIDSSGIQTINSLIKEAQDKPKTYFEDLTASVSEKDELKKTLSEDENISKLMSSFSLTPKKASESPYRNSLPITRESSSQYVSFLSNQTSEGFSSSRPKSYHEENLIGGPPTQWSSPINHSLTVSDRIRPKSMYEPVMLNRTWHKDEGSEVGIHLPVGEADALTWNIPLSPTVQSLRHPFSNQSSQSHYTSISFSDDLQTPSRLTPQLQQDPYINNSPYSAGLPQRNSFLPSPISRTNQLVMGPSHVNSSGNWLGFKDKPKRRSYGDHEIFPQGARNMFSNLPNTFKKHLMKPQNKVDFDILQDVPAWLRSLRLHKYTDVFDGMVWQDIIQLGDEELNQKGISALGARRKMLKHFELIKQELHNKNKVK